MLDRTGRSCYNTSCSAGLAHLVERHLAKVEVASSSLVARSRVNQDIRFGCPDFFRQTERTRYRHPCAKRISIRGEAGFLRRAHKLHTPCMDLNVPTRMDGAFCFDCKSVNILKQEELNGSPWNLLPLRPACDGLSDGQTALFYKIISVPQLLILHLRRKSRSRWKGALYSGRLSVKRERLTRESFWNAKELQRNLQTGFRLK